MFTKADIFIENDFFLLINKRADMVDYEKRTADLYALISKIIKELNITSLSKVIIKNINLFDNEAGKATTTINRDNILSEIELSRKTFVQFDNNRNVELRNQAIATIYHEFYHVHDKENIYNKLNIPMLYSEDLKYYKIGVKYWSEFFAYYNTCNLYISNYPYIQFDNIYIEGRRNNRLDANSIQNLFYFISNIIAYSSQNKCLDEFDNYISLSYLSKNINYIILSNKLNEIRYDYPNNISTKLFIDLGKLYCNLIKHFLP